MNNLIRRLNCFSPKEKNIKSLLPHLKNINPNTFPFCKNIAPKGEYYRNILYSNANFELVEISWGEKSFTKIHGHDKGCMYKLLNGELIESFYDASDNKRLEKKIMENSCYYIDDSIYRHKITNTYDKSRSLHIYPK